MRPEEDVYSCPAGKKLTYRSVDRGKRAGPAPLLDQRLPELRHQERCTTGKERRIARWEHEHVLEAVQKRLDEHPEKMRQRRETVEHPFGTIKARMGATHFLMKTLPRVASEMALHVLAYNLTRVMNIMGDPATPGGHEGIVVAAFVCLCRRRVSPRPPEPVSGHLLSDVAAKLAKSASYRQPLGGLRSTPSKGVSAQPRPILCRSRSSRLTAVHQRVSDIHWEVSLIGRSDGAKRFPYHCCCAARVFFHDITPEINGSFDPSSCSLEARRAAWVLLFQFNSRRIADTCSLTVLGERKSASAICLLVLPSPNNRKISS